MFTYYFFRTAGIFAVFFDTWGDGEPRYPSGGFSLRDFGWFASSIVSPFIMLVEMGVVFLALFWVYFRIKNYIAKAKRKKEIINLKKRVK